MGPEAANVLVVDDEPAIRALVAKIVERAGFPVDSARDGAEAIARLEEKSYAVLVVDLMMPNVDGFALIEYVRDRGGMRPAIIVISAGDSAALRRLDGSMVHSILRKPFDIDVLGDLITAAARSIAEERQQTEQSEQGDVIPFPRENAC
jgi:DNA-binding response OmpR family regulator